VTKYLRRAKECANFILFRDFETVAPQHALWCQTCLHEASFTPIFSHTYSSLLFFFNFFFILKDFELPFGEERIINRFSANWYHRCVHLATIVLSSTSTTFLDHFVSLYRISFLAHNEIFVTPKGGRIDLKLLVESFLMLGSIFTHFWPHFILRWFRHLIQLWSSEFDAEISLQAS